MADDYTYTTPDPEPSKEILDLTKQMVDVLKDMSSVQQEISEGKASQRDLTQEAIDNAKEEAMTASESLSYTKSSRTLKQEINAATEYQAGLASKINEIEKTSVDNKDEILEGLQDQIDKEQKIIDQKKESLKVSKKSEGSLSFAKAALDGMSKIPFVWKMIDSADAMEAMKKEGGDTMKALSAGAKSVGESIRNNMGPALLIGLFKSAMEVNAQMTDLQTNLGISREEAEEFRDTLADASLRSGDILSRSSKLLAVNQQLNDIRGTAIQFDAETLEQANRLLTTKVMTIEAMGELSKMTNVTGGSIRGNYLNQIDAVMAVEKEHKTRLNMKKVLEEANKTTGQIRAQLGGNPAEIAKAVAATKALGMELKDVASASKSMLDFESSISAELEAELLTGKQINLEKARLAALTGDYKTVAEEITKNVGTFYDFSKMNVLQQDAMAKAHGMTSDSMSDMLMKQGDIKALAQEARDEGREDIAKNMEKLSLQENFNEAMLRLKEIFVDQIAPALEKFLAMLDGMVINTGALKVLFGVGVFMGVLKVVKAMKQLIPLAKFARSIMKGEAVAKAWSAAMSPANPANVASLGLAGAGVAVGLTAAILASVAYASMDDGIIGPDGGMVVSGPKGSIQLDKKDSIIAGTNLGGGGGGEKFDYNKMAAAMANTKIGVSIRNQPWEDKDPMAWGGDLQKNNRYETDLL